MNQGTCFSRSAVWLVLATLCVPAVAQDPTEASLRQRGRVGQSARPEALATPGNADDGQSSRDARIAAIRSIPFEQLTPDATQRLRRIIDEASYFRRMPTQTVACDTEMYLFLIRHPEVVVSLWDVMGMTKVTLERIGEYQLRGNDGVGTKCNMDLIYGSENLHIYQSQGAYSGNLWARELQGRCVVCIHNQPTQLADGTPGMVAWMDAFLKLENVGADLAVKALGPFVSKTADHNFAECAGFFSQISQTAWTNPEGLVRVASRLPRVAPPVREQFATTSLSVATKRAGVSENVRTVPDYERDRDESPSIQILSAIKKEPTR
ncbi:MAG: hypothetical protein ACK6DC_09550 [Planctomycetota bacterium]